MKFEKLSENKIRITLTAGDLKDKDIDFHDFMSNPLETQDLFLDILEEAKEKVGFNTTDYRVKIEALAMIDGDFVVNVTRMSDTEKEKQIPITSIPKKKFKVRRKSLTPKSEQAIYKFDTFDDYCYFIEYLAQNNLFKVHTIAKEIVAYMYQNEYYLIFHDINAENKNLLKFYSSITEFGTYINNSTLLISKLEECGKIIIKNNALKTSLKHFNIKPISKVKNNIN